MAEYGTSTYGVGAYGTIVDDVGGDGTEQKPALTANFGRVAREWGFAIVDLNGSARAFIDPSGVAVTVKVSDYCTSKGSLLTLDEKAGELGTGDRALKVYVDGKLRHHGVIVQPLEASDETTDYTSADPWYGMQTRMVQLAAGGVPLSFDNTDAMDVLWALVTQQESRQTTRIQKGTFVASTAISGEYTDGQSVADAGSAITTMENGPFFRVDPVDGVRGVLGSLSGGPDAGVVHEEVRFEYGEDTLGNIDADFKVQENLPMTAIKATGGTDANGNTLTSYAVAPQAVLDQYDLREKQLSFPDVTDQETLDALAAAHVQTVPVRVYTVNTVWDENPTVPRLWDDFDRGDTVGLRIRHGWLDVDAMVRVNECTVELDDDSGRERLTELVLEEVA